LIDVILEIINKITPNRNQK